MIDTLFVGLDQMKDMFSSIQTGTEPSTEYEGTVKQIRTLLPEKEEQIIEIKTLRDSGVNRMFLLDMNLHQRNAVIDRSGDGNKIYQISITLNKYCF